MPRRHREHASWTPQRIQGWANNWGPRCRLGCVINLNKAHPEQARVCLGLLLSRKYAVTRSRGLHAGLDTLRSRSILQNNRDQSTAT